MLLRVFERLVEAGESVVVIEHNLEVIQCADHIIDLGPEAGVDGGEVVVCGTPEEVAKHPSSHTWAIPCAPSRTAHFGCERSTQGSLKRSEPVLYEVERPEKCDPAFWRAGKQS
jgi:ABC-type glutathione transport system ATPase component